MAVRSRPSLAFAAIFENFTSNVHSAITPSKTRYGTVQGLSQHVGVRVGYGYAGRSGSCSVALLLPRDASRGGCIVFDRFALADASLWLGFSLVWDWATFAYAIIGSFCAMPSARDISMPMSSAEPPLRVVLNPLFLAAVLCAKACRSKYRRRTFPFGGQRSEIPPVNFPVRAGRRASGRPDADHYIFISRLAHDRGYPVKPFLFGSHLFAASVYCINGFSPASSAVIFGNVPYRCADRRRRFELLAPWQIGACALIPTT